MTEHYIPCVECGCSEDELAYLRAENDRLNKLVGRLTSDLTTVRFESTAWFRTLHRERTIRRISLDNQHLWERNFELMGKLARALKKERTDG